MKTKHAAVLMTVMLVLAGCSGGTPSTATTTTTTPLSETTAAGPTGTDATTAETAKSATRGTVEFYVSDEKNAMGDFEHLNVTVSKVGLKSANDSESSWTEFEVDNRSIDLTELTGANATHLDSLDATATTYDAVFVYVADVNATLKNGERVNVKLPSGKLQIHQQFTVGANESTDFVFDISVFKAGKSGKYILKPVISESGTDVEIDPVEKKGGEGDRTDKGDDESALNASFVGDVARGENVTVEVTANGSAVANATVTVNGAVVGETDADGRVTISVPDATELEVEIETDDGSAKLKHAFETGENGEDKNGNDDGENGNGKDNGNGNN